MSGTEKFAGWMQRALDAEARVAELEAALEETALTCADPVVAWKAKRLLADPSGC